MAIERLLESLLNGEYFHCRPIAGGPTVKAIVTSPTDDTIPNIKRAILCPVRQSGGVCGLRDLLGVRGPRRCLWHRGDGTWYLIYGPITDKKTE